MAQLQLYVCKFNHLTHTHTYTHRAELHVIYTHNLQTDTQVCTHQISLSLTHAHRQREAEHADKDTQLSSIWQRCQSKMKACKALSVPCKVVYSVLRILWRAIYTYTNARSKNSNVCNFRIYLTHIPTSFFLSFSHLTKACWAVTANYALLNQCCYCNTTQSDRILSNEY